MMGTWETEECSVLSKPFEVRSQGRDLTGADVSPSWRAGTHLYRLRCWPAPGSLAAHRDLPRLANLLTTRSLRLSALSALSDVDEARCEAFLADMARQGILVRVSDFTDLPMAVGPRAQGEMDRLVGRIPADSVPPPHPSRAWYQCLFRRMR